MTVKETPAQKRYCEQLKAAKGEYILIPGNIGRWLVIIGLAEQDETANSGKPGIGVYRATNRLMESKA